MAQLWKKYRPNTVADMVGCEQIKADTSSWAVAGTLRCGGAIFGGPPGTGKTTAARAIAKDLLGSSFDANFHEFNSSDERGIAFVRDRLKPLAEQQAINHPFKVINLDEADGLTHDAQDTLRQIIELTSPHTLWILTCNRIGRIIPAIRSRLPSYTFKPLEVDEAEGFLVSILHAEGFPTTWEDSLPALIRKNRGDLRACLKTLQVCNPDDEDGLLGILHDDLLLVEELYSCVVSEDWDNAISITDQIIKQGITRDESIEAIHRGILDAYEVEGLTQNTLKHLLILGQWAARSPDWTAGDLLFLQSMIGDYKQRG